MINKRIYAFIILIVVSISFLIVGYKTLYNEWRLYNVYGSEAAARENLIALYGGSFVEKIAGVNLFDFGDGLDIVSLSIPEKSKNTLMYDLPSNIKEWQRAFLYYPNGSMQRVKLRFRGDNPINWAYEKKSWRLKTRKKNLIDRNRIFNYVIPQDKNLLSTYLSYYIADSSGILTPEHRMIELVINGKSQGVYFEYTQLDEGFLRKNDRMPVNLYKGEQYHTERAIDRSNDLFDNPFLWRKSSTFNQRADNDHEDLKHFMNVLRNAETSESDFKLLKSIADIDVWAKFAAYQTLVQSWHNDNHHNMRMLSDVWKGTIEPIIHDTGSDFESSVMFESSPHTLLMAYNKHSEFLSLKYKYLYNFLQDRLLVKAANHVETLKPRLNASWDRDLFHTQHAITNGYNVKDSSLEQMGGKWNQLIDDIHKRQSTLESKLQEPPLVTWHKQTKYLSLVVGDVVPASDVTLYFDTKKLPKKIAYDKDGDGKISKNDIFIPFITNKNTITLKAEFYANRVISKSNIDVHGIMYPSTKSVNTQFNLIADIDFNPYKLKITNPLTLTRSEVSKSDVLGHSPSGRNNPVIKKIKKQVVWTGEIIKNGVTIIDYPVVIMPGTKVRMKEGASIIFTNFVAIKGQKNSPVIITGYSPETIWGTFAIQGQTASGSSFSNVTIEQGSGYISDNNVYSAMFSIHDSSNIDIDNLTLNRNYKFDDMLHIVYGKNITINKCSIMDSFSDAIDIDISTVSIKDCNIFNSGNDGIDLMSSSVLIERTHIKGSKDKGVSIGEASSAVILNSVISDNNIGIETKDSSSSKILFSELRDNEIQLNAYAKNWRYGKGGNLSVYKSILTANKNNINAGKKSSIIIYDSKINPNGKYNKKVKILSEALMEKEDILLIELSFKNRLDEWNIALPSIINNYGVQTKL
jgi:hypothetical protein